MIMDASVLTINEVVNVKVTGGVTPYRWLSSNNAVLQVNQNANNVRAVGAGLAYITIKDNLGEVVSSSVVEVRDIKISSQRASYVIGETEQFFASGGVAPYSWQVDNTSVASISGNGFFQAKATGTVNVSVIDSEGIKGKSKIISINENNSVLHSIKITPFSVTLSKRSTTTIKFVASGGLEPYHFSLSNKIGSINSATGEFSPQLGGAGITSIIVADADGHTIESGVIELR